MKGIRQLYVFSTYIHIYFIILETASIPLLDLGFAISASSQDATKVFQLMKEAIRSIASRFETSNIRYALLTFGDSVNRQVNFTSDLPGTEELEKALGELTKPSGDPDLEAAFIEAKMMFKQAAHRPGAKKVLVLIMDKKSSSVDILVVDSAKSLEDDNIKVVPVGIGLEANLSELEKTTTNMKFMVTAAVDEDPQRLGEEIMRKALKSEYPSLTNERKFFKVKQFQQNNSVGDVKHRAPIKIIIGVQVTDFLLLLLFLKEGRIRMLRPDVKVQNTSSSSVS